MSQIVYLKAACEQCSGRVEYPSELAGESIECPHCHKAMPLPPPIPSSKAERDAITSLAIKSLEELVKRFPRRSIWKSAKTPYDIVDVSIDAKKTDSLIYPVIGIINLARPVGVGAGRGGGLLRTTTDFYTFGGQKLNLDELLDECHDVLPLTPVSETDK